MEKMPEWPERISYAPDNRGAFLHQRAIAEYWESRCRVAVEALRVAEQARLEVMHAKEVGPNWYTRGERGMQRQVLMWDGKAGNAVVEALAAIGPLPEAPTTHNQS